MFTCKMSVVKVWPFRAPGTWTRGVWWSLEMPAQTTTCVYLCVAAHGLWMNWSRNRCFFVEIPALPSWRPVTKCDSSVNKMLLHWSLPHLVWFWVHWVCACPWWGQSSMLLRGLFALIPCARSRWMTVWRHTGQWIGMWLAVKDALWKRFHRCCLRMYPGDGKWNNDNNQFSTKMAWNEIIEFLLAQFLVNPRQDGSSDKLHKL